MKKSKVNKIFENPNSINLYGITGEDRRIEWNKDDGEYNRHNIAFTYLDTSDERLLLTGQDTHIDAMGKIENKIDPNTWERPTYGRGPCAGRLFTKYKVITFWTFPENYTELKTLISDLNNDSFIRNRGIKIDNSWKVEYPVDEQFKEELEDKSGWGSWYPNADDVIYLPINKYVKPYTRSKEELEQEHVISPLLKKQKKVPSGVGSNNLKYKQKQAMKRLVPIGDSKQEGFYPRLFESPDSFIYKNKSYNVTDTNSKTYCFTVLTNSSDEILDIVISKKSGLYHYDYEFEDQLEQVKYEHDVSVFEAYPGRLYMKPKVITFWTYPSEEELKILTALIERYMDINILKENWVVEVYGEGYENRGNSDYCCNYDRDNVQDISYVHVKDYIGSSDIHVEPGKNRHTESPIEKIQEPVDSSKQYGWGAAHPKYQQKQAMKRLVPMGDSKQEGFYPRLFEGPDAIRINGEVYRYTDNYTIPGFVLCDKKTRIIKDLYIKYDRAGIGHTELREILGKEYKNQDNEPIDVVYPFRLYLKPKVLSFWVYPSKTEMLTMINMIKQNKPDLNLLDGNWKIEVYEKGVKKAGASEYYNNFNMRSEPTFIAITDFLGGQKLVGSAHPKYQQKQAMKRLVPMGDSKQEGFYPRLFD